MKQTIVIIGRANVGKSTLFNRLTGTSKAMVSDTPGTTRDLKYGKAEWSGREFELIDTGGFLAASDKSLKNLTKKETKKLKRESVVDIDKQVEIQARKALNLANLVLFVTDAKEGINPQDKEIAGYLKKTGKPIVLVINKCDGDKDRQNAAEFYGLGLKQTIMAAASSGSGTGDILDAITEFLPQEKINLDKKNQTNKQPYLRVAIIGRPNAGKSSLLNAILGEEKYIVSATAHTTREPNDTLINYEGKNILLIDTAGIRRKAKIDWDSLEKMGVRMSIGALKTADFVLFVIDVSEPITHQDMQLAKMLELAGASVIMVANKYDLAKEKMDEDHKLNLTKKLTDYLRFNFPHLSFAPILFTSALSGWNTKKILAEIIKAAQNRETRLPDSALNRFLKSVIAYQPPPRKKVGFGARTKIKRAFITNFTQIGINPPTFECQIGSKEKLPEEYRRYIINNLRGKFGFVGTPIKLVVRWKKGKNENE